MHTKISAIIVAAGSGARLGASVPKAFVQLGDMPLFAHSLLVFDSHPSISEIVLVVSKDWIEMARNIAQSHRAAKCKTVVAGGEHRWQSAAEGVGATSADTQWVMIHDAARPFVTHAVIDSLLPTMEKFKGAVTVTPEVDTIRRFSGDRVLETIDRSSIVRIGTPQMFHKQTLLDSFAAAPKLPQPPTDEAMLMELRGIPVGLSWGDPGNFKITTPDDLAIGQAIAERKRGG
jgi:2-C-methyl-D-erythritol 4-phosphate cytidylyltransferase